ncbi:MAG TPA: penicillin acylase family protein [Solirubrobacteraceae bacterium]|nr:penicillin acylase family protein [Solirubrobacteraceae bacterium]
MRRPRGTEPATAARGRHAGSRRFTRGRLLLALAIVAAAACFPASAGAAKYTVSLTRTTGGVENISGANFADVGFGIGYGQAQDGICLLAETFLTVDGERSAFFGPEGTFKNEAEGGLVFKNLYSDIYWTSVKDNHTVQKLIKLPTPLGPGPQAVEAVKGYAAGYDAYLEHIGGASGVSNPACKGAAWVRPIKPIDVWLRIYQVDDLAGNSALGPAAEANPAYGAPASPATKLAARHSAQVQSLAGSVSKLAQMGHSNVVGSNGLAVGGEDATNGGGVVLANPHFPWHGSERWWEMGVEVPGSYHAIGAGIWGLPGITIGHNQNLAWTHTVSTNTSVTFWVLQPAGPEKYMYKGKKLKMKKRTVTVQALEHGEEVAHTYTLHYSVYGPVIWESGLALAIDDANINNLRGVNQWLAIGKAENASQVIESERTIQGVPWVNTIGADDLGNAFYTEIVVASSETTAFLDDSNCQFGGAGSKSGPFLGNGECELPESPGAIVPGILAGADEPALVRKDYVENSNNSFWLANANSPLTGFSPALGGEEENPGMRSQTGIDMVAQRMGTFNSGIPTDGLSPVPGFTAETLQQSYSKFRSLPAERALPGLREICESAVTENGGVIDGVNVSAACPILNAYDAAATLEDKGAWLFQEWFERAKICAYSCGAETSPPAWIHPWTASEPVYTPNTLNTSRPASKEALAQAVSSMEARGLPLDVSIGEVQRAPQAGAAPIPGCIDGDGCFAAIASSFPSPTAKQAEAFNGNSIVMFTELQPGHEPVAKGLLTYSQSEDPTSPYYEDQTQRFSKGEWITLPWTPAQVQEDEIAPPLELHLK